MSCLLEECTMCQELLNRGSETNVIYKRIVETGKNILYRRNHLNIIPSLGALNSNHIMILPNYHSTSISRIEKVDRSDLFSLMNLVRDYNKIYFDLKTVFFEHGSCTATKSDSSCVEHAHLHALATNYDLFENLSSKVKLRRIAPLELFEIKDSYLLFIDDSGVFWINNDSIIQSQLLRRIYCELDVTKRDWNWRIDFAIANVLEVIDNYGKLKDDFL